MSLDAETIARMVLAPAPPANIQSGMVLAAGRGTRLGPLGLATPKALLDIGGSVLLDQALDAFTTTGVANKVVNASHLAEQVVAHVGKRQGDGAIRISEEKSPLETGGGVLKALPLLGTEPFYAVNADVWWSGSLASGLRALAAYWRPQAMDVLLLLQATAKIDSYDGRGDFYLDGLGQLTRKQDAETAPFVFTGAQILSPAAFAGVQSGAFSLNRIYDQAAANGRLFGVSHSGGWADIGTPQRLTRARNAAEAARARRLL
ncbi:MAG: nucleotidyltransferase family protein [Alphaproteobacteria bacterium]|jgi:N-acetyl-alpha-D-muramate 1-phosphate uridylyltransferase|nr:nucleotidyltransferase family protein [Alphaproteobacteria bacterium]